MLKIGNLNLKVPFFQAPLNGYSDYAMRRLAVDFDVPLTFAGVMLAKSAAHPKTLRNPAFRPHVDEHPVGAQIIGRDPSTMASAARALQDAGYDIIDLNFACPTPKVIKGRRGGWLMNDPDIVLEIYKRVREAVTCPVTMKLRRGYDSSVQSYDYFYEIVSEVSKLNIDAITIHGRTVLQRYTGNVDWDFLSEVKRHFPRTTIIGSGDLFEPRVIFERLKKANLDGVLIARGAIGNPWIYQDLHAIFNKKPVPEPPTLSEQGEIIRKHFEMICRFYDSSSAVKYFRKFLVRYCGLHPMRRKVQQSLTSATDREQLLAAIEQWYGTQKQVKIA
ncbi:MAG: tRNA-dihydrouridine synthase [Sedimentisphaerales bacterium]